MHQSKYKSWPNNFASGSIREKPPTKTLWKYTFLFINFQEIHQTYCGLDVGWHKCCLHLESSFNNNMSKNNFLYFFATYFLLFTDKIFLDLIKIPRLSAKI